MTVRCVHDGVAQYARGEFLDERRNSVRFSLICLLDLSRQRILPHHLERVPPGLNRGIPMGRCGFMVVALAASGWWAMCRRVTGRQSPWWPLCAGMT